MTIARRALVASSLTLALCWLPGCGGGGGGDAPAPGGATGSSANYGSLSLSGSGTAVSGVTFHARSKLAISGAGFTTTSWYGIDLRGPLVYPFIVVVVIQDSTGAVVGVDLNYMTSETDAAGEWANLEIPAGQATATSTGVSFSNVVAPSYGPEAPTSLTLNGTLNF